MGDIASYIWHSSMLYNKLLVILLVESDRCGMSYMEGETY